MARPLNLELCPGECDSIAVRRVIQNSAFDLFNRVGDVTPTRAGLGTVEDRAATPDARAVAQNVQALGAATVAAVEDEPVRVHDGCRANPLGICPDGRTRPSTRAAENAFSCLVEAFTLLG